MEKRRTPIAVAIAVLSLGLVAACSDEADQPADAPVEQVTPAPGTTPMDTTPPADSTPVPPAVPETNNTMPPPVEPSAQPDSNPPSGNDPIDPLPDSTAG